MPLSLVFHESQYPAAVHAGLVAAVRERRVPARFLYDSPGQAARWLAYHDAWAPNRTRNATQQLYEACFSAAWARLPEGPVTYVGVGCGGGEKDAQFLSAAPQSARPLGYVAADTSPTLVMTATLAAHTARPEVAVRPLVIDLTAYVGREAFVPEPEGPVVWSLLGILPNLDAEVVLPYLRRLMAPEDLLVVSANLTPEPYEASRAAIRAQYDNPEAHAWYLGALDELGLTASEANLEMSDRPLSPDGAVWRVEAHAVANHEVELDVFHERVPLHEGARLEVFHSDRYLPEVMPSILEQHGLQTEEAFVTEDREEGLYVCRASEI